MGEGQLQKHCERAIGKSVLAKCSHRPLPVGNLHACVSPSFTVCHCFYLCICCLKLWLLFFFFLFLFSKVGYLHSPGQPQTQNHPISACWVLGLQVCAPIQVLLVLYGDKVIHRPGVCGNDYTAPHWLCDVFVYFVKLHFFSLTS
jgi:hypothetical protein